MVGVARIELATPAMSTQCSTTELHAHSGVPLGRVRDSGKALNDGRTCLQPAVLILGLEQPIDFGDEVFQVERLAEQLGFRRRAPTL